MNLAAKSGPAPAPAPASCAASADARRCARDSDKIKVERRRSCFVPASDGAINAAGRRPWPSPLRAPPAGNQQPRSSVQDFHEIAAVLQQVLDCGDPTVLVGGVGHLGQVGIELRRVDRPRGFPCQRPAHRPLSDLRARVAAAARRQADIAPGRGCPLSRIRARARRERDASVLAAGASQSDAARLAS